MAKEQSPNPDPSKLPKPVHAPPEKVKINPLDPPPPIEEPSKGDKSKAT